MSPGLSRSSRLAAAQLARTCAGRVAPNSTLVTSALVNGKASASVAAVVPSEAASAAKSGAAATADAVVVPVHDGSDHRRKVVRSRIRSVIKHVLLILGSVVMIYPLLWMLVSSFRPTDVIFHTPGLWLNDLIITNYTDGWNALSYPFSQYIINSAIVVIGAVAGNLFACSLAAYAFARLRFPRSSIRRADL